MGNNYAGYNPQGLGEDRDRLAEEVKALKQELNRERERCAMIVDGWDVAVNGKYAAPFGPYATEVTAMLIKRDAEIATAIRSEEERSPERRARTRRRG